MILEYIEAAMRRAKYEILEDGTFYAEVEGAGGALG